MPSRGISLANKCQLLFGLAVLLILTAALSVPWFRMQDMVRESELEIARQVAHAWIQQANPTQRVPPEPTGPDGGQPNTQLVTPITLEDARRIAASDPFIARALQRMTREDFEPAELLVEDLQAMDRVFRCIAYVSYAQLESRDGPVDPVDPVEPVEPDTVVQPVDADGYWGLLLIELDASSASRQLLINRTYIILSGCLALALATLVFYFITTRLILSPVRVLRETAERVSKGDLHIRSDIATGDEFEELSETFNLMLANLKTTQDQLRQINKSLDLRLNELAESNVALHEANVLKSEFLANVSHELRTPLNSILGFAEVIRELEQKDGNGAAPSESPGHKKRTRYVNNILNSGRDLLDLINDLLDLARIEAGRVEIMPEPISIADVLEGLATLIGPQAEKSGIHLEVDVSPVLPIINTDPAKFQQIIFNFLSNAVKFTPDQGRVTLSARAQWSREDGETVRVSVQDTGPGISEEDQEFIFEKFRQVDASHTRAHQGTGLGLAICKELATLLGGHIELVSRLDEGSTFTLVLPTSIRLDQPQALMPDTDDGSPNRA